MGTAVSGLQAFHIEVSTLTTDYSPTLKTTLKVLLTTMALSWFAILLEPPILDKDRVETLQSVFDMYIRSDPSKRLYCPDPGRSEDFPNLQPVLSNPIRWDLINQQYDEQVKFTTALREGTTDAESILRRFTRT